MTNGTMTSITPDDAIRFACHSGVSCFNQCCRDLNQALTPYDVLRLRRHLGITSREFLDRYTSRHLGPATGLPIVSLRFDPERARSCPFVASEGCRVYPARPASCRLYPLARAVRRSRIDGRISVHYAVIHEAHCRGFEQCRPIKVRDWIAEQDLTTDFDMNDALMELIALKNRLRPGPLPAAECEVWHSAWYDLDEFKARITAGQLEGGEDVPPLQSDDAAWLKWSFDWVSRKLFGPRGQTAGGTPPSP